MGFGESGFKWITLRQAISTLRISPAVLSPEKVCSYITSTAIGEHTVEVGMAGLILNTSC